MDNYGNDPPMRLGIKYKDGHWVYKTKQAIGVTEIYMTIKDNDDIVKVTIDKAYRRK